MVAAWVSLVITGTAALALGSGVQREDAVAVRAVRFYRGDVTVVHGLVEVPIAALGTAPGRTPARVAFRVDVAVRDTGGVLLSRDSWTRGAAATTGQLGSSSVETWSMVLKPGAYLIDVSVTDSVTGRRLTGEAEVAGYTTRPGLSDLLVASHIRAAQDGDTTPGPGELRKGDLLISTAPSVSVRPSAAALFFYSEVYRDSAQSVPWHIEVVDTGGRVLVATPERSTAIGDGGGAITGSVDLAGLPPGKYVLRQTVGAAGEAESGEAAFRMAGFDVDRRVTEAERISAAGEDGFSALGEARLDELFEPLVYLASRRDLAAYDGLSVEGKRRFLRAFWQKRDPTPATVRNEVRDSFYARVAVANQRYGESGRAGVAGWRTDRGRIYVLYGEPDETLHNPQAGATLPWEAWKYLRDRPRKYVFMDETRLGNYVLVFSDDVRERSYPNWESILGDEIVQQILRF